MKEFNFKLEPGKSISNNENYVGLFPLISVIIPFYNSEKYIEQTIISVLNQTFPYYEMLIIDDGSIDKKSLDKLDQIKKLDNRIKVFHKENGGLASARDFGASRSSEKAKYLMFLDDDDLIEKTFLECAYWTLETNDKASWTYSDSVGFGTKEYTWNKYFNSDKLKRENELISQALVRKTDFFEVNGYELREKAVNEDWNFWLKLLAKGKYPVHMSFYGQWYRRKEKGELQRATQNRKRSLEIINETAKNIKEEVKAIQYPRWNYNYDLIIEKIDNIVIPKKIEKENKINLLFIIPWMITGGADFFNLKLIRKLDKNKFNIVVITTEPNINVLKQKFEDNSNTTVYDLTSFLDHKYWIAFINYIIEKTNINMILNSNSKFGYSILPYIKGNYPNIPIIDYVHMEEWYNRNGGYSRYSSMYESIIDKTLVCNANTKRILEEYFGRKSEEIKTVYIGVDEERFDPEKYNKDELKTKYLGKNQRENEKIITYICRITEQKRPLLFLEIINELKKKRQDFKVLVTGNGNLLSKMKEKTKKLKLTNNIIFLENIKNVAEIYRISDITVNCSLKEGLAFTAYESLSMNVPVISSDVGGQKELINEETGKIIPLMQNEKDIYLEKYKKEEINEFVKAIDDVLNNLEKYKKNCRKRICELFTIKKMIANMEEILEEIYLKPNENKINNGKGLSNNKNILKEIITENIQSDGIEYNYECLEYEKRAYGKAYSQKGLDYKKEILKEKLWKNPLWRLFIGIYHKLLKR